jgi:N-alpha-acetyl-L-2,4-diaminobutyrate deacetylase
MRASPVTATLDLEADGIQHGFLKLPHSHDASAWGAVMIPITVVKRGEGPTALLTGANHGDEYEGPISLFDLAGRLTAAEVTGRVIIVPAMNYPAFRAAKRTSPIDGGNMNRVFPGRPDGGVTEKIADYFQRVLLPMADLVVDIHAGGKTLEFVPFAAAHRLDDTDQQEKAMAAVEAFGAPYSLMLLELDSLGMYDTAAEEMGKIFVSTELGGGGSATALTAGIAKRGVANVLKHAGIFSGAPEHGRSIRLDMPDGDCYVMSETAGLIEYCVELGDTVCAGDVLARIHDVERTGGAPVDYHAKRGGLFIGRHFPGLIALGDPVGVIGVPA